MSQSGSESAQVDTGSVADTEEQQPSEARKPGVRTEKPLPRAAKRQQTFFFLKQISFHPFNPNLS